MCVSGGNVRFLKNLAYVLRMATPKLKLNSRAFQGLFQDFLGFFEDSNSNRLAIKKDPI